MSSFQPAAWQVRRARVALEQWNAEHPDRLVAWETVEEALLAWRGWKEKMSYDPEGSEQSRLLHEEHARRLPRWLLAEVFPQ